MKPLTEHLQGAYMIRRDGKVIKVTIHPYANPDDIEETLYAGEWLYNNTLNNSIKSDFLSLVHFWIEKDFNGSYDDCFNYFSNRKYKIISLDFLIKNKDLILNSLTSKGSSLLDIINNGLNQEFLRARYGGYLDSAYGSREMVFRVSSNNFNWFNIIYEFVYNNRNNIDCVTISKDPESTGIDYYFYKVGRETINKLDIDDFIMLPGNPIVEELSIG